jgi:hypothetical protein
MLGGLSQAVKAGPMDRDVGPNGDRLGRSRLVNLLYLGKAVHKGVAYPGEHAAIIDERTWDKTRAVMAEPAHPARRHYTGPDTLLKGLIFGPNGRAHVAEPHPSARPDVSLPRDPRGNRGWVRLLPGHQHPGR